MILTPVDTLKTTLQVEGSRGLPLLRQRVKTYGFGSLFYGAWATAAATFGMCLCVQIFFVRDYRENFPFGTVFSRATAFSPSKASTIGKLTLVISQLDIIHGSQHTISLRRP